MAACSGRPRVSTRRDPCSISCSAAHLSYSSGVLGNADLRGTEFAAAILPGWRFVRNGVSVIVFLGYDFQRHSLRPDDPSAGLRGNYHGAAQVSSSGINRALRQ